MEFDQAEKALSGALVRMTHAINLLAEEDIPFQRASNPAVSSDIDAQREKLVSLGRRVSRRAAQVASAFSFKEVIGAVEPLDQAWSKAVDFLDALLEKADSSLDEFNGLRQSIPTTDSGPLKQPNSRPGRPPKAFRIQNLEKPQLLFPDKPSNHESKPFKPLLNHKPHAIMPLDHSVQLLPNDVGVPQYQHPYQQEIERYSYPARVSRKDDPIPYKPFDTTEPTIVESFDDVLMMLDQLKQAKELAIDLEHHDAHSYAGIVSLMQISTREHDWIIDTLKTWRRELEILNEVFADPTIVKVLHGAHSDVIWLQRDFGLYIVGLFDTYAASRALGYTGHSLAFLLKRFIDFDAKKQYQMADWRIRPLPQELLDYARSDTHFLLYIYDRMRNELVDQSRNHPMEDSKFLQVLGESKETCLQRFERPLYDENGRGQNGFLKLFHRHGSHNLHDPQQIKVFEAVHRWRDFLAREEDENPIQIMPNHALFNVAREIPSEAARLLAICHPISEFLRKNVAQLLQIIEKAKSQGERARDSLHVPTQSPRAQTASYLSLRPLLRSFITEFWGSTNSPTCENDWPGIRVFKTDLQPAHAVLHVPCYSVTTLNTNSDTGIPHIGENDIAQIRIASTIDKSNETQVPQSRSAEVDPSHSGQKRSLHAISQSNEPNVFTKEFEDIKQNLRRKTQRQSSRNPEENGESTSQGFANDGNTASRHVDYTQAQPVFSTKLGNVYSSPDSVAKSFNPYAMASNAAPGLKKAKLQTREKSKIFKRAD